MRWFGVRCHVNLTGLVEPFIEDRSMPHKGLDFLVHKMVTKCSARVHPFCPSERWPKGLWFPVGCLCFPGAFCCAVLMYYVCQICKVQNTMMVEGIKDSLIHTIVAKYRDHVVVAAIFDPIFKKEESGQKVMDYFLRLLPHVH